VATQERLDPSEVARYSRHLTLPEVGMEGQLRLRTASVLIVGAGGLGSPLAIYLAAAGVGRLGVVDFDRVDLSNLQRQVLFGTNDVGSEKSELAARRIRDINPHVNVTSYPMRLTADNALDIMQDYDVVIDGTDNFPTRYLVNDACVMLGKPNVYGSIFRFEGQVSVFWAEQGPCYRCLYPEPPEPGAVPNCAEGGVLGILPGVIGTLQATEAIKLIIGRGELLLGRLLLFDALEMRFRELTLRKDSQCPVCGPEPRIRKLKDSDPACAVPLPTVGLTPSEAEIDAATLSERLQSGDRPVLLDVRTDDEWRICRLPDAVHIPLQQLSGRFDELDSRSEIVVYCHVGGRSAMAVNFLRERGFERVRNLIGGIDVWSLVADPQMPRY
jgi:adenylyltransferase/sulfurtransferase